MRITRPRWPTSLRRQAVATDTLPPGPAALPSTGASAADGGHAGIPRETRDTLFVLAIIGWIAALQWGEVPAWTLALVAAVLAWRGWLAWRHRPLPGWPVRLAVTALAVAATIATHHTLLGPEAGVTLVVVLLALKTLELRAQRDAYVIFFLGFFVLLTPLLHSQSLLTALGLLPALWGLLTALVLAQRPLGYPSLWQAARTAGALLALGTPLMVLLFVLFPRLPPLWGIPTDSTIGRSGLSGQMRVGDVARLALDDRVALRVAFPESAPARSMLYFRGPVLRVFDGSHWRPLHGPDAAPDAVGWQRWDSSTDWDSHGEPLRYEITLAPSLRPWLVTLDGTRQPPTLTGGAPEARLHGSPDGQWWLGQPVSDVLRYRAEAEPLRLWGRQAPRMALQIDRELPPGFNPRTLAWAQRLRRELGNPEPGVLVEALLRQLREGGYRYTLEPGQYGRDTADEFWFDRRAGFCEHIASSFVIALRAMDVPARVVTGYQGGERNPIDGLWTIRHSDAHAWAEVWLPEAGWVRVDPTAAVAPQRTDGIERLTPPPGPLQAAVVALDPRLHTTLRLLWDAANQRWNDWVLNYGTARQLQWLRHLGWSAHDWRDVAQALGVALAATAAAGLALLWCRRARGADAWQRLLWRAARRWQRRGWPLPQPLTARALHDAITGPWRTVTRADLTPPVSQTWGDWLLALERLRYDPHVDRGASPTLADLRRALRRLPPPPMPPHPP
ncbi:transglutaminase family protein, partial [Tepidimonas sp.]|uniref:transglutaminase family protein n=1 Tax=Tepidimonas sp. TaxID=2002775 RepID=UPI002FE06BB5